MTASRAWFGVGTIGWRPRSIGWRTAALFMVGSACFALGSAPGFSSVAPVQVCGVVFFVGSLFFTSAGFSQLAQAIEDAAPSPGPRWWQPRSTDWWASIVQSAGTLWFNLNTFDAMRTGFTVHQQNLRIWTPDFIGSICFLVASELAIWSVCHRAVCVQRASTDWWISAINMVGSIFFMASALAAFVLPATGDVVDASLANTGTFLGALCFFWAARLLVVGERSPAGP